MPDLRVEVEEEICVQKIIPKCGGDSSSSSSESEDEKDNETKKKYVEKVDDNALPSDPSSIKVWLVNEHRDI